LKCSGGKTTAAISCYGDVRFCPHDTYIWGNILHEDLKFIWKRIVDWRDGIPVPPECINCSIVADCGGGCRVASKLYFNDFGAKDPWARNPLTNYQRKVISNEFDPESEYKLPSDIRWRKENGSFLLHYQGGNFLVSSDILKLLETLPEVFIPSELLSSTSANKETHLELLKVLYNNGFLFKIVNKKTQPIND
jgi:radical SAM protein with 4Fe4S-binding SPASM domain